MIDLDIQTAGSTIGLDESLHKYLLSICPQEHAALFNLRQETAKHSMGVMQIAREQGHFMALLVQLMKAKRTLDIGVFTGYSSLCVALALPPDGEIVACDVSEEDTLVAQKYWQQAGVIDKIDLRLAPAIKTLNQLLASGQKGTFDFAFIDADKENYAEYYELCLQLVRSGGIIMIDNTLWLGKVVDSSIQDQETRAIRDLNKKLQDDKRIVLSQLPIADGVSLALKRI
ncbi:class I SAM-dependent methyltransferase [Leptolyngbya sp. Heron Island J]|uniref:class I SAM-dependent methyltransferase n=1 Tax=Leptolyngbya sp. Heron Island J TaxID=1385935 RepID=UPI0003FEFC05|nr:class I SAM-dependent methyltransferase [Leptolyngbya sp. Heron Island J]